MKKLILPLTLLLAILNSNQATAQAKSSHVSLNIGASSPIGDLGYIQFVPDYYNKGYYPFIGGGAYGGINFGVSSTYYFTKHLGISLDYQFVSNDRATYYRQLEIEKSLGDITYSADINKWKYQNTLLEAVCSFPLSNDKFILDFKSGIGISTYSLPLVSETFQTSYGTTDVYGYSDESYVVLSTKFAVGARYFFNNFGVGVYVNTITAYSQNNSFVSVNYYEDSYGSTTYASNEVLGFNLSNLNTGISLTYRFTKQ